MNYVLLSIGSNVGDREARVNDALAWLSGIISDFRHSHVYITAPYSGVGDNYANCVAEGHTALSLDEISAMTKDREVVAGRTKDAKISGKVPLDIDIVIYNDTILRPKELERQYFLKGYTQLKHHDLIADC